MKPIILLAKSIWYCSPIDEELFFEWIKKIPAVIDLKTIHDELHFYIKNKKISENDLRELIALFYKYGIEMSQLSIFLNSKNKEWFYERKKTYWHKKIFGKSKIEKELI